MISQDRDSRDIEMFRVPPICLDDIPEILLCKFLLHYLLFFEKKILSNILSMLLLKNTKSNVSQKLSKYSHKIYYIKEIIINFHKK